jgi:hypothetical protein
MLDLPRLGRGLLRLIPRAHRAESGRIADIVIDTAGAYIDRQHRDGRDGRHGGVHLVHRPRLRYSVPLATVVAVCGMIPMIGTTLGAVISVLVTLLVTGLWPTAVIVAGFLGLPAARELPDRAAYPPQRGQPGRGRGAAGRLDRRHGPGLVGAVMAIPIAAALKVVLTRAPAGPRCRRNRRRCRWP